MTGELHLPDLPVAGLSSSHGNANTEPVKVSALERHLVA